VRIRIALTAAMAVITGLTAGIFTTTHHHQTASAHSARKQPAKSAVLSHTALAGFAIPHIVPVVSAKPAVATPATPAVTPAATPVTPPVAPVTPPPVPVTDATSVSTADWACIRVHESGDQYNNPSEPSGAYGILISTWRSFGYSGWPYEASPSVQDALALRLYSLDGFRPWSSRYACGI
jgi:hypothetical protein